MKFRILSKYGDGLAIGDILQSEGYEVDAWIESDKDPKDKDGGSYKNLYDGILTKVEHPEKNLSKDDIIICDMTGMKYFSSEKELEKNLKIEEEDVDEFIQLETWGDYLREQGYKVIGGGKINDALELDRHFGQDIAREAGFRIPEEKEFTDYVSALRFVQDTKKRYVLKPSGSKESYSVYPSRDWQDLAAHLEHIISKGDKVDKVLLQEFTDGVQMGIEGTWNGKELVGWNSTFEHKRLLSGHTGVLTGETGSIVFYYPDPSSKLPQMVKRLEPILKQVGFPVGQIDCNFIINEEGAWFLEFTPRQGYPATYIQLNACEDWGVTFDALASGELTEYFVKPHKYFGGINCFVPEYPYGKTKKEYVESPTFFQKMTKDNIEGISFIDAKVKDGKLVTGGTYGNLFCSTGYGETPREVSKNIIKVIKEVEVYPLGYRNDIGQDLDEDIKNLKSWVYFVPETSLKSS